VDDVLGMKVGKSVGHLPDVLDMMLVMMGENEQPAHQTAPPFGKSTRLLQMLKHLSMSCAVYQLQGREGAKLKGIDVPANSIIRTIR